VSHLGQAQVCRAPARDPGSPRIAKTTHDCLAALAKRLEVIHSYALPELVALTPSGGSERVLAWVRDECESR